MENIRNNASAISQFIRDYVENSGFEISDESSLFSAACRICYTHDEQDCISADCIDIEALDRAYDFIA